MRRLLSGETSFVYFTHICLNLQLHAGDSAAIHAGQTRVSALKLRVGTSDLPANPSRAIFTRFLFSRNGDRISEPCLPIK